MTGVYIGIGLAVGFALVLLGLGLTRAADLGDHMLKDTLTEREVQQHIYPDGNVHVLPANEEMDQSD